MQWYITYDRNHSQHFPFWEITWTMAVQCSVENRHSPSKTINRFFEVIADEYYCIRVKLQFYCTTTGEALSRLKVTTLLPILMIYAIHTWTSEPLSVWITSNPPSNNIMQQRTTLFQPTEGDRHCLLCDKI